MKEVYYYSPSANQFMPESLADDYKRAGTWPDDAQIVADEIYQKFAATPAPAGKMRGAGNDGLPLWLDQPALSPDECRQLAEAKKSQLLSAAAIKVAPLEDAVELGIATDDEKEKLIAWKKYRVLLGRVDISNAPDISWPEAPARGA